MPKDENDGVLQCLYGLFRHIFGSRNSHGRSGEGAGGHFCACRARAIVA